MTCPKLEQIHLKNKTKESQKCFLQMNAIIPATCDEKESYLKGYMFKKGKTKDIKSLGFLVCVLRLDFDSHVLHCKSKLSFLESNARPIFLIWKVKTSMNSVIEAHFKCWSCLNIIANPNLDPMRTSLNQNMDHSHEVQMLGWDDL